jgi:hypothetical protein
MDGNGPECLVSTLRVENLDVEASPLQWETKSCSDGPISTRRDPTKMLTDANWIIVYTVKGLVVAQCVVGVMDTNASVPVYGLKTWISRFRFYYSRLPRTGIDMNIYSVPTHPVGETSNHHQIHGTRHAG